MSIDELLLLISEGLKRPLTRDEIFTDNIKIGHLKRIDKIFNKGLHYYLDPKSPEISRDASIFFRKPKFESELNIGAKKIVHQFEDFKISLSAISKLAEVNTDRILPIFDISQNPKLVAEKVREKVYPEFNSHPKEFLKGFITKLALNNVLVFEFVETWNKKDKANIDGFFIDPNVIVIKRQQTSFRREVFTLAHELGHYLLNEEEVEQLDVLNLANSKLSAIETWCNDFAYYFLIGNYAKVIDDIVVADRHNDYQFDLVQNISKNTHLSQLALFTKLLYVGKISNHSYAKIKADFDEKYRQRIEAEKKQRELDKIQGIQKGGAVPKPINSPLLISTIQTAFYEGLINEYDVCKALHISPDKLEKYLS